MSVRFALGGRPVLVALLPGDKGIACFSCGNARCRVREVILKGQAVAPRRDTDLSQAHRRGKG